MYFRGQTQYITLCIFQHSTDNAIGGSGLYFFPNYRLSRQDFLLINHIQSDYQSVSFQHEPQLTTERQEQNGRHFAEDILKCIYVRDKFCILISIKFILEGPVDNMSALVPVMAWRRTGDKLLHGPMLTNLYDRVLTPWVPQYLAISAGTAMSKAQPRINQTST